MYKTWLITLVFMVCAGVSGTVGKTTLTVEQMPSHHHTMGGFTGSKNQAGGPSGDINVGTATVDYTASAGNSLPHTHGLSGSSGAASSLPPHYALAFVMRVG